MIIKVLVQKLNTTSRNRYYKKASEYSTWCSYS